MGGFEVGIAHCDVDRIGVVAVADTVDEVGTVGRVGYVAVKMGLLL